MELREADPKNQKPICGDSSQIWNQTGRFASGRWKISLMLVNTSKTRSGGKTLVFRVKRTLSEPGNNHSAGFGRIHPPGNRIHLSPEKPPGVRSKVTSVSPLPVSSPEPLSRDEVTQVTLRGTGSTRPVLLAPRRS